MSADVNDWVGECWDNFFYAAICLVNKKFVYDALVRVVAIDEFKCLVFEFYFTDFVVHTFTNFARLREPSKRIRFFCVNFTTPVAMENNVSSTPFLTFLPG